MLQSVHIAGGVWNGSSRMASHQYLCQKAKRSNLVIKDSGNFFSMMDKIIFCSDFSDLQLKHKIYF